MTGGWVDGSGNRWPAANFGGARLRWRIGWRIAKRRTCAERRIIDEDCDMSLDQEALSKRLFSAARDGSAAEVKLLLARGASPRYYTQGGRTALIAAAVEGQSEACEALLACSDTTWVDVFGRSALMLAASNGHLECVKMLENRSRINDVDCDGWSALMYASIHGHVSCAALLARMGALNMPDNAGETPLMNAVRARNVEMALALIPIAKFDVVNDGEDAGEKIAGGSPRSSTQRLIDCEVVARAAGDVDVAEAIAARIEQITLAQSIPSKEHSVKGARL